MSHRAYLKRFVCFVSIGSSRLTEYSNQSVRLIIELNVIVQFGNKKEFPNSVEIY